MTQQGKTGDMATHGTRQPFTARSVLASALLGEEPPELAVAHLVDLVGLFGINENRARVALSRMAAAGEVTTDGSGRYRLAGRLLERKERQGASRLGRTLAWQGTWRMVVVTASGSPAEDRAARRKRLVLARLAEQREGFWLRPDNIDLRPDPAADADLALYSGVPDTDPVRLATALWDLRGWAGRAGDLCIRLDRLPPRGPADLAPGFELSAAVLRHLQADPLLPAELLPPIWPGPTLREAYTQWDRRYRHVLRAWARTA
ncbi:MAG TPA: PaaX family transcriptional regulator C-terminal domain-containing protein [Acidimicrobiales bacterium]|nr:PaaX family transcriptional regulator C-terminal domain-containing protein [Acidimicrobiales bacterium]